jgi:DNA-binding protein
MKESLGKIQVKGQDISMAIHALAKLASKNFLSVDLKVEKLKFLILALQTKNPQAQNISSTIYALGELAKAGRLADTIPIENLFIKLVAFCGLLSTRATRPGAGYQ